MNPPFTSEQFFAVFAAYNSAVWPMQVLLWLMALVIILLAVRPFRFSDRVITFILAFFWIWMGLVYHITFFSAINRPAYIFGAFFIIQGLIFLVWATTLRGVISYRPRPDFYGFFGGFLMLYGILIYPALGFFLGHHYPYAPTFGLPCPTTIFTFGLLLWSDRKIPKYILVIPLIWSFIGFGAALQWQMLEDIMLPVAGLSATSMLYARDRKG